MHLVKDWQFYSVLNPKELLHRAKADRRKAAVVDGAEWGREGPNAHLAHTPLSPSYELFENHRPGL